MVNKIKSEPNGNGVVLALEFGLGDYSLAYVSEDRLENDYRISSVDDIYRVVNELNRLGFKREW